MFEKMFSHLAGGDDYIAQEENRKIIEQKLEEIGYKKKRKFSAKYSKPSKSGQISEKVSQFRKWTWTRPREVMLITHYFSSGGALNVIRSKKDMKPYIPKRERNLTSWLDELYLNNHITSSYCFPFWVVGKKVKKKTKNPTYL